MTVPTISNLPTVPATSDPNFETEAPALFNHIKNTFVSEMNSAISFINSSTFDATVEFKNANFTAARNFLYMIDTSSAAVSVTLPANPSTGDQLLLMDQKRNFGTNNLTIVRNNQNINGAASNVVSKSTGALIRCIFQASYGWTVDLYEGEWESGTSAGDLVYNGGNVGIGTSSPENLFDVRGVTSSFNNPVGAFTNNYDNATNGTNSYAVMRLGRVGSDGVSYGNSVDFGVSRYESSGTNSRTQLDISLAHTTASTDTNVMTLRSDGKVGIGTSAPESELHIKAKSNRIPTSLAANELDDNSVCRIGLDTGDSSIYFAYGDAGDAIMQIANSAGTTAQDLFINPFGGKVGIGTSSPSGVYKLSVENTSGGSIGILSKTSDANSAALKVENSAGSTNLFEYQNKFTVRKNSTDAMVIDSSGNVGIGTSSPGANLDLRGGLSNTAGGFQFGMGSSTSSFFGIRLDTSGDVCFDTYKAPWTETLKIDRSSGDFQISTGNLVIGTAGKGIDFSATSGTGTSELLDDYEEGTWTPVVADASSGGNTASGSFSGTYTKVGRIVTVHGYAINVNTTGLTSTNQLFIRSLPFNNGTTAKYGTVVVQAINFSGYCVVQLGGNNSFFTILEIISGSNYNGITVADLTSGSADILFSLTYETS